MSYPDVKQKSFRYHQWLLQEIEKQLITDPAVGNAALGCVVSKAQALFQSAPGKELLSSMGHWELKAPTITMKASSLLNWSAELQKKKKKETGKNKINC